MYTGKYFDGKQSGPHACQIQISHAQLHVNYKLDYSTKNAIFDFTDIERVDVFDNGEVAITLKSNSIQSILLENSEILTELKSIKVSGNLKIKNHTNKAGKALWIILSISILFIIILALLYFKGLPIIAEKIAMKFPYATEKKIGDQLFKANLSGQKIDSMKSIYAKAFFDSLHISANKDITVTVVKSNEINAYAMPGGHIVVYDTLLTFIEKPEQLAALLAHEYAHIKLRHSLRGLIRQGASTLFFSLLLGDTQGAGAILAQNADKLKGIQYSREMEQQADEEGFKFMEDNNINPIGMLQLFEKLDKGTGSQTNKTSEFLSTHPLFKTRMEYLKAKIDTANSPNKYKRPFPYWDKLQYSLQ